MKYSELVKIYEKLEATTKKLEKRDILADFYKDCGKDLYKVVLLSMGVVVTNKQDLGVAKEILKRIIIKSSLRLFVLQQDQLKLGLLLEGI